MKVVFALLVLLPLVYCAALDHEKRWFLDSLGLDKDFVVNQIVALMGNDGTEKACHSAIATLGSAVSLAEHTLNLCHLAILEVQKLAG